ncbi:MAG: hypothetical protein ACMXYD_02925 [Candidatus Woesearchaeota archaeon]
MNKLARIIETLSAKELVLIQQDLQAGTLQRLIQQRLHEQQRGSNKHCPVCQATIRSNEAIKIEFGSPDLRRAAYFDATDCLEHFITNNLKKKRTPTKNT